jgi:hypothetical protein
VSAAVTRCLCERVYPTLPAPGEIRRFATEWMSGEMVAPDQAFDLLMRAVRLFGCSTPDQYEKAKAFLGESIWEAVKRMGGWSTCCDVRTDNREAFRGQFRGAWERLCEQVRKRLALPAGIAPKLVQPHEAVENFAAAVGIPQAPKAEMKETQVRRTGPGSFVVVQPATDQSPRNDPETLALRAAQEQHRKRVLGE